MTEAEFREAYQRHKNVLYRFAWRMTGSGASAEDIVHDCFLALWRKPSAYDPSRGTLRAFLLGVVRNLVLKHLRDDRPAEPLEDETSICGPIDIAGRERAECVARAVAKLPPLQRETLILAEYEELALEEIARITQAEVPAVKSRLHRARQNLRRMLEPLLKTKGTIYGTNG